MRLYLRRSTSIFLILTFLFCGSPAVKADDHLVSSADLQKSVQSASAVREQHIDRLERFVNSPQAREAIRSLKADPVKVSQAIPQLSNEELSDLATQLDHAQANFAAGYHEHELITTLIIVLLVVAIVVVVASAAD